jgi:anthranilate phosphoribosyltransferase
MPTEQDKRAFGTLITKLIHKEDLNREEATTAWDQVLKNEQPPLQQGAFLAALAAKGEAVHEIGAAWESITTLDTNMVYLDLISPLVENCGTGMDPLKTFNISTAASVVAAANGIPMAKHGARAITSKCGTVDVLEHIGVDVECGVDVVKKSIETAGIGIFNGMSPEVHPQGLGRLLADIRFGTTLNIAGSLANPAAPTIALRGVYNADIIDQVVHTMRFIGYKRAMVVFGWDADHQLGMDECSTLGKTDVAELHADGTIDRYTLDPVQLGIQPTNYEMIASEMDVHKNAIHLLKVLYGIDQGPKRDIVCLNAAPLLYLADKVKTLEEGIKRSYETIEQKRAFFKLEEWVASQQRDPKKGKDTLNKRMKEIL